MVDGGCQVFHVAYRCALAYPGEDRAVS